MSKKNLFFLFISVVTTASFVYLYFNASQVKELAPEPISAADGSAHLTTKAEWESGTGTNIDTTSSPDIVQIDNRGASNVDLTDPAVTITVSDFDASQTGTSANLIDGDTATSWRVSGDMSEGCAGPTGTIIIDLGDSEYINEVKAYPIYLSQPLFFSISSDNITYTSLGDTSNVGSWISKSANSQARYVKYNFFTTPCFDSGEIGEISLATNATATHTSSPTQLDSGEHDSVSWTTFVPSAIVPNDTTLSFKFRTSADATTWSAWSASSPYAASIDISSLAQERYLQVESTLTNTDGLSTPTLDSYTANYEYDDIVPPACDDGIQNQGETDIDCGGPCDACPVPETCSDGLLNQDETDVDCGGVCGACPIPPTCSDNIQNQGETGVDCGGPCTACIVPESCSDGIKNQNEDKTDCGGVCPACPVEPTCSDGIKNQNETGVDCGGVCGECPKECKLQECNSQAVDDLKTCHSSGKSYETCVSEYCTAIRSCYRDCGYYGSIEEYLTLVQPNGGESYKISENVPIRWFFTSADKRTRVSHNDISLTMSLSLDGGISYTPLRLLVPSNNMNSPLVKLESDRTRLEIGTYQIDYVNQSYSYSWIPTSPSYVTDQARIKLEPNLLSCVTTVAGDSSDNDFKIWADSPSLYVKLVPTSLEANPGEEMSVKALSYLSSGEDVSGKTTFVFSVSKAASALSNSANTLNLEAGTELGYFDRAIMVRGIYGTLSADAYGNIKITEPVAPPPEECGLICEFIGIVESLTKANPSTLNLLSLAALLIGLANGLVNSVLIGKDLIAPFLKGKNKKNSSSQVYNSLTGQPVPGAKIMLINKELGNLAAMTVSDRDGRYSLELSPNKRYQIQVDKVGFSPMNNRNSGLDSAGLPYTNNYLGGEFTAGPDQLIFSKNIPMLETDPELEIKRLLAKTKINNIIFAINLPLLVSGSIVAVAILYNFPILFNYLVACLYLLSLTLFLIRSLALEGKSNGVVINASHQNKVVDLALIRAIRASDHKLEHTVLSDHEGRYSLAVPKGIYKVFAVKSGLEQTTEVPLVVRSSFRPSTNTIEMHERQMSQPEPNTSQSVETENAAIPAPTPPIANNSQPVTIASQPIDSSYSPIATTPSEMMEKFEGNQQTQI